MHEHTPVLSCPQLPLFPHPSDATLTTGKAESNVEQATGTRRETASAYLKAAGIAIRAPRQRRAPPKPASPVSTDLAKPASEVSTDFGVGAAPVATLAAWPPPTLRAPRASACEPYRELIDFALERGDGARSQITSCSSGCEAATTTLASTTLRPCHARRAQGAVRIDAGWP